MEHSDDQLDSSTNQYDLNDEPESIYPNKWSVPEIKEIDVLGGSGIGMESGTYSGPI